MSEGDHKRRIATSPNLTATSPARFAWLLGTTEPPTDEPCLEELVAARAFALANWRLSPIVSPRLGAWAGQRNRDAAALSQVDDLAVSIKTLTEIQLRLCHRFIKELERRQVPYALLKGSAVRLFAYPDPSLRGGVDVDIAVPARYLEEAEHVARSQGFLPVALDATGRHFRRVDPIARRIVEANHHELGQLARRQVIRSLARRVEVSIRRSLSLAPSPWHVTSDDQLACYVVLDIHHGLSLDIAVDEVVARAHPWSRKGYTAFISPPEWIMLYLIFKIYWEGVHSYGKGAYQYADLVRLAPKIEGKTASALINLLSRYRLEAAAYYVLRRLGRDFGVPLIPELSDFLVRASSPPISESPVDLNDMGDMWPKIWGYR